MRPAALLLLLAAPCALGFTMPSDCGVGSSGPTTCYNGATFRTAAGAMVGSPTSLPLKSYPDANTVCVLWQFHCTTAFAGVVAFANATNPLVGQALPCSAQTLNMTVTVATGMDATYCAGGLQLISGLATYLDTWAAWTPAVVSSGFAARPVALVVAVTLAMLAAF